MSPVGRYEALNAQREILFDMERMRKVKQRFLNLRGVFEIEAFLSGWFNGAPFSTIKRRNVEDFVAYGFYTRTMNNLPEQVSTDVALVLAALLYPGPS